MSYRTNARLAAVAEPPIAEAHGWIAGRRFPAEKPLIDVAQAVPGYPPPRNPAMRLGDRRLGDSGEPRVGAVAHDNCDTRGRGGAPDGGV